MLNNRTENVTSKRVAIFQGADPVTDVIQELPVSFRYILLYVWNNLLRKQTAKKEPQIPSLHIMALLSGFPKPQVSCLKCKSSVPWYNPAASSIVGSELYLGESSCPQHRNPNLLTGYEGVKLINKLFSGASLRAMATRLADGTQGCSSILTADCAPILSKCELDSSKQGWCAQLPKGEWLSKARATTLVSAPALAQKVFTGV